MTITTLFTLFPILAAILSGGHADAQTVALANRVIQLEAQVQAAPKITFSVPPNTSIWPNIVDVTNSAYLNAAGSYSRVGTDISLDEGSLSFGDLNSDGFDDAALLVERVAADGTPTFALAAMLNQGGVMFNIADIDLGKTVVVYSHHIVSGQIILDMQIDTQPRAVYTYQLLGNTLSLVSKVAA
jgi:hypothetical protein